MNLLRMRRKNLNLKTKTSSKLYYHKKRLEDLQECLKADLTKDCRYYCNQEINSTKENIEYYESILELLKEGE